MDSSSPNQALPFSARRSEREELLTALRSENERKSGSRGERRSCRFHVDECMVECRIEHPGGGLATCEMLVSDISATGIGVVSRVYMHIDTVCTFSLMTNSGDTLKACGRVVWCKLLERRFHAAGVVFEDPIDPKEVVSPKAWMEYVSMNSDANSETLRGKVLLIESSPVVTKLIEMMLGSTEIELQSVMNTGAALDMVKREAFDAVILGLDVSTENLDAFLSSLRGDGHQGPIIFVANDHAGMVIEGLVSKGYKYFLGTPIQNETLLGALNDALQEVVDPCIGTTPIYSQLAGGAGHDSWIIEYVDEIKRLADTLQSAIRADDLASASTVCNTLHATGAGYGFAVLSDTASSAITALNASCSAKESAADLRQVLHLIERIVPPK